MTKQDDLTKKVEAYYTQYKKAVETGILTGEPVSRTVDDFIPTLGREDTPLSRWYLDAVEAGEEPDMVAVHKDDLAWALDRIPKRSRRSASYLLLSEALEESR